MSTNAAAMPNADHRAISAEQLLAECMDELQARLSAKYVHVMYQKGTKAWRIFAGVPKGMVDVEADTLIAAIAAAIQWKPLAEREAEAGKARKVGARA